MIVGVTGYSSGIGQVLVANLSSAGHTVVKIGRKDADRKFTVGEPVDTNLLSGLDSLVHLAWDWTDNNANIKAGTELAGLAKNAKIQLVLLSTFSVFSPKSEYGQTKIEIERQFLGSDGSVIRAGVVWGDGSSGIVETLRKFANIPLFLARIIPDPRMFHSEVNFLVSRLLSAATGSGLGQGTVENGAAIEYVPLSTLLGSFRKGFGIPIIVPVKLAYNVVRVAEHLNIRLPLRSDSIAALLGDSEHRNFDLPGTFAKGFPPTQELVEWARAKASV